ncbi:MAG: glycoside hydrolase family 3 C-terminal domain-containing protein [Oscillospiraceae bacterium]|nr:glycoside hydrolase family 3 C-terminal domain-containing protein [Oscillospiraceae bacterium]
MEKKKLKLSNRAFRRILIPILSVFLVLLLIVNAAASVMASTIDTYVGGGAKSISTPKDTQGMDADYYPVSFQSNDESTEAAYAVAQRVAEEGSVLLKNDGLLPLAKGSTVVPFGYAYLSPIYVQLTSSGSAKWVIDPVTPEQGLSAFTIDPSAAERMQGAEVEVLTEAPGTKAAGEAGSMLGGDCKIYEYNPAIYDGMSPIPGSTGVVFVTRSGQEGQDQKFDAYADGTPHYLALSENEKGAIRAAKSVCDSVILVLVSSAPMELMEVDRGELSCDAILWIGHPGERGFATLSDLLDGDVNPSGRTVDTYSADFTKDPSYQNIGLFEYANLMVTSGSYGANGEFNRRFTEYQEGVYMGYRYYETADLVDPDFDYDSAVVYPFGYGLSYTTFEQELLEVAENDGVITATVQVTNTGDVAGREVVQLYNSAPYTDFDIQNQIEKPAVDLVAFGKTGLLQPGESEAVTLTFTTDDLTSYCYTHPNPNGTVGCYVLEEGNYILSLRRNSHEVIAEETFSVHATIWYDGSDDAHIRQTEKLAQSALDAEGNYTAELSIAGAEGYVAATNQFQTSSDYMNTDSVILSRANWKGTQPKMPENRAKEISPQFAEQLGIETSFEVENDPTFGNVPGSLVYAAEMPASKANNGLTVSMMRGLDYNDPKWELLLDQIDWDADKAGILMSFTGAAYATGAIDSIGLPSTVEQDGANGLKVNGTGDGGYDMTKSSSFGFAPLMAATWNTELIYEVGRAFGAESIMNGINGWYCPAINLHRSFFNGRVFEYYSEDPVLSGKLAAAAISGAGDMGMFCYVKHFALNDTDTGRDALTNFWADEQTMRELYLKAFEIAFKEARMTIRYYNDAGVMAEKTMRAATAVMPAQNCVGTVVGHANYNLLTNVLRGEWGFQGMVVSDYWVWNGNNLRDLCLRTGCDTYLCMYVPIMWTLEDYDSPTARSVMRTAIHNIAYTTANSNAMQGYAPGAVQKTATSPWKLALYAVDVIFALLLAGAIVWMVLRARDDKLHPEKYKHKVRKVKKARKSEV